MNIEEFKNKHKGKCSYVNREQELDELVKDAYSLKKSELKITLKEWDYTCADGCCTDYGTQILIDGKEVVHYDEEQVVNAYVGCDVEVALRSVLKHLGFENVEVEREYETD